MNTARDRLTISLYLRAMKSGWRIDSMQWCVAIDEHGMPRFHVHCKDCNANGSAPMIFDDLEDLTVPELDRFMAEKLSIMAVSVRNEGCIHAPHQPGPMSPPVPMEWD